MWISRWPRRAKNASLGNGREPWVRAFLASFVKKNHVEVGPVTEFPASQFAVTDDGETGGCFPVRAGRRAMPAFEIARREFESRHDHALRHRGERGAGLLRREARADIRRRHAQHVPVTKLAQHFHLQFEILLGDMRQALPQFILQRVRRRQFVQASGRAVHRAVSDAGQSSGRSTGWRSRAARAGSAPAGFRS